MIKKFNVLMVFVLMSISVFSQTKLVRHVQISPDATQVAFSCYGDIFTYNLKSHYLKRLTINQAYDSNPVWKANGKSIAFASNRKSNTNVFTVGTDGGLPKQLTFYPTSNIPTSWDNNDVVFTTTRVYAGPEWDRQIYKVNENGETPQRLLKAHGSMSSVSPDGRFIAFVKGACKTAREDYSGSAQRDVWIYNVKTKEYHQITDTSKNEHTPKWDADNNLYFIGASSGRYNIYKQKISNNGNSEGYSTALTTQKIDGIREFSVSNNGTIVYAVGIDLFTLVKGKAEKLTISLPDESRFENETVKSLSYGVSDFSISPDEKQIAFEVNGEIFVKEKNKKKKRSNNVSKHPFLDKSPVFVAKDTLFFLSDRDGQFEIYRAISKQKGVGLERSLKIDVSRLTKSKEDVKNVVISPNRKKIAYQVGRGTLMICDIDKGEIVNKQVFSEGWNAPSGVSWSPDSKWIAYSQKDLNFDSEIFIQSVDDKTKKTNVSMHPRSDVKPKWSPDGKKLIFSSNRSGINYDVWMVWLTKKDWEKTKVDHEEGGYAETEKEDSSDDESSLIVTIDLDKIYDRLIQVTTLQDNEFGSFFSSDSDYIYYSGTNSINKKRNLFKVKWDGTKPKEIKTSGSRFQVFKDYVYLISKGEIHFLDTKLDKVTNLPFKAIVKKNLEAEKSQVFEEGLREITAGFYDPDFHGYNWTGLVNKYRPWVLNTTTHQDYSYMFNLLLGQLNASHMGYRASKYPEHITNEKIGLLGLDVTNVEEGLKVNYVLPNSIADKSKVKIKVGDVITSVNNVTIDQHTNLYQLLKYTQGTELLLTFKSRDEIVLRPQSSLRKLQYEAWEESRQKLVEKFSNGQLGYIHIKGMNTPSFERFERDLKARGYGKKGIVIDVRYNGGGWTTDRLLAVLNVKQHAYTIPRGATNSLNNKNQFKEYYPFNERAILSVNTKPLIVLCNENSYSNAEIFSHAVKTLKLGKLVGQPTFGAVISTGGKTLANGYVRMPFRAWFNSDNNGNMENEAPAIPDYLVKNLPGSKYEGKDAQLQKAVELLLKDI